MSCSPIISLTSGDFRCSVFFLHAVLEGIPMKHVLKYILILYRSWRAVLKASFYQKWRHLQIRQPRQRVRTLVRAQRAKHKPTLTWKWITHHQRKMVVCFLSGLPSCVGAWGATWEGSGGGLLCLHYRQKLDTILVFIRMPGLTYKAAGCQQIIW